MIESIRTVSQWVIYPIVLFLGLTGYLLLQTSYPGVIWTAYIPVLIATLCLTALEFLIPHNRNWRPSFSDIKTDTIYMILVQVGVPLILGLGIVSLFHTPLSNIGSQVQGLWPHHWHVLAQAVLLLVIAEFFSYWLHRVAHTVPFLWRLHAVHHSPDKLYWLNVGRFHPLEKIFQYMVSTFPFMLLGVSQDVIGIYFVFYGINGFFQHSNIKIKYGILNFIISSATLHRWHHSPSIKESNHNYGNNLIIWDLIFGTWYLPKDRQITKVGSGIEQYPQSFLKQLINPFRSIKLPPKSSFIRFLNNMFINIAGLYLIHRYWNPFINKAKKPEFYQKNLLEQIIVDNAKTKFGSQYEFSEINSENSFKKNVPITQYEDIEHLVIEQGNKREKVLFDDLEIFYARTSGTTGRPKDIPITEKAISQFKNQQRLLTSYQYQICPEAFLGKVLAIVSPAIEGELENGIRYGSVSGVVYETMPAFMRSRTIVPAEVFEITDYDLKYRVITRLALAQDDITYLGAANPSTFIRIQEVLNEEWENMLESLLSGKLTGVKTLPKSLQQVLSEIIKPEPDRYKVLKRLCHIKCLEFKDIWPSIHLLTTWTGGNCQFALERLKGSLPVGTKIIELGYVASEMRGTLTCDPNTNAGLPLLDQVYYEFIEKVAWDNGLRETLSLTQIEKGKRYYIIVTTIYGLYRYFMNDLIEVCGSHSATPLLKFIQKGNGVTNITGEKLYESQINQAILNSCRDLGLKMRFHLTLANVVQARYELYLEINNHDEMSAFSLAHAIDDNLSNQNIEYSEKRKSGRLHAPKVYFICANTYEKYKKHQIERGQREGQYKIITLLDKNATDFPISDYVIEEKNRGLYDSHKYN